MKLTCCGDELVVHIGNLKRNIVLPKVVLNLDVESAKAEGGGVSVIFEPAP